MPVQGEHDGDIRRRPPSAAAALIGLASTALLAAASVPLALEVPAASAQEAAGQEAVEQETEAAVQGEDPREIPESDSLEELAPGQADDAEEPAEADPMVELYVAKCASCHTIGEGARVGPDLQDVHTEVDRGWLRRMIQRPSSMLSSDPRARRLLTEYDGVKMPDLGLGDEQVEGLIDLIVRCSTEECDLAGQFTPVAQATPEDVARGERLFLGEERFANEAGSCISCHTVRGADTEIPGGTLAVDLTNAYARLGDEGLDAALKNPAFALMTEIFSERPLEQDEVFALRAFLHQANLSQRPAETASLSLPLFGLLGAGLTLLILNAFWGRRLRGVRKPLTQGGRTVQKGDLLAAGEGAKPVQEQER